MTLTRDQIEVLHPNIGARFFDGKPRWEYPSVVQLIDTNLLCPDPNNKRPESHFQGERFYKIEQSIRHNGILDPLKIRRGLPGDPPNAAFPEIAVQDLPFIESGHRRKHVCDKLGISFLPCSLQPQAVTRGQSLGNLLGGNCAREDLAPVDLAVLVEAYRAENELTYKQVADHTGITMATLMVKKRLLKLPPDVQKLVNSDTLTEWAALELLRLTEDAAEISLLAQKIVGGEIHRQQLRLMGIRKRQGLPLFETPSRGKQEKGSTGSANGRATTSESTAKSSTKMTTKRFKRVWEIAGIRIEVQGGAMPTKGDLELAFQRILIDIPDGRTTGLQNAG